MSYPVKVSGEWYDALKESAFQNGISIKEALRRHLERDVPAVPSRGPNEDETEPDEGNTGQAWLSLLVIGAIVALGAVLIARFFRQPEQPERNQGSDSVPNANAYQHPYGYR